MWLVDSLCGDENRKSMHINWLRKMRSRVTGQRLLLRLTRDGGATVKVDSDSRSPFTHKQGWIISSAVRESLEKSASSTKLEKISSRIKRVTPWPWTIARKSMMNSVYRSKQSHEHPPPPLLPKRIVRMKCIAVKANLNRCTIDNLTRDHYVARFCYYGISAGHQGP